MSLEWFLKQRLTVEKPRRRKDASGGVVTEWQVIATGVKASVQPILSKEKYDYAQRQIHVTHRIYFSRPLPEWEVGYQLVDEATGATYVSETPMNTAGQSRLWKLEVREQPFPQNP